MLRIRFRIIPNNTGKRHDAGDKQGFLRATVELGLKHPTLGPDFRTWLKSFPADN